MNHHGLIKRMAAATVCLALAAATTHAGAVLRLYYDGVPGTSIQDLRDSNIFPDGPTFGTVITEFLEGVENAGDDYGSWFRGYLEAPQSGDYTFWVSSDDDAEFWLSTDHTVGNLQKVAENIGAVGDRAFDEKPAQQSGPITLERGNKYYFELLHKDSSGAAHVAVGWELPDGTMQRPLPGDRLHPLPISGAADIRETEPVILTQIIEPVAGRAYPVPTLQNQTVTEGSAVTFRVTVEATQPATFQWMRNGEPIEDANLSALTLDNVSSAESGDNFSVEISNSLGNATAGPVTLTVQPDIEAPTLVAAATRGNPDGVDVEFSEGLDEASATNTDNYEIAPDIDVTGAELVDEQTVRLATSPIAEGAVYTLTVNNVMDQSSAGNEVAPDSQIDFLQVQGVITEKEFRDIPGPLLTDLTGDEKFPDNPDAVIYSTEFETLPFRRDNYGVQFQGYVIPPETGEYIFYVSSRSQSVLFLSPDEDPANMVEIAREPEFSTDERDWESQREGDANISEPQMLEAGHKYYIEGRMKAAARTGLNFLDHFAVTWQRPGEAPPVNGDPPIPGDYLSSTKSLGAVSITSQPADQTVTELRTATFSVEVDGTPPYEYRWLQDGEAIPGGTGSTLVIDEPSLGDNGAAITVEVSNAFSQASSDPATLNVNVDDTAPEIEEIIARNVSTVVNVQFSERINAEDATDTDNYSIEPGIGITNAELQEDQRTVLLTTSDLSSGVEYTLTVNNIRDRAGEPNAIASDTTATFRFVGTDRITRGLQVLYDFREGSGTTINDVSGVGTPLDLTIEEPEKVTWLQGGGVLVEEETRILSEGPAIKINQAAVAAEELTVEVWVKPDNVEQEGPARIVTVSEGPGGGDRNFSLNQGRFGEPPEERSKWSGRLSDGGGLSGGGTLTSPVGTATTELQHVVFTVDVSEGTAGIYVDGELVQPGTVSGDFSDWVLDRELALVNEAGLVGSGRSWLGELHLVAVYAAALTPEEIQQNYQLGPGPTRVTDGIQALYTFQEGEGTTIEDVSGIGVPLNLMIEEPEKVSWRDGGGLVINVETRILSDGAATKINEASMATDQLTVEAWVKPENVEQQGPARIVTVSDGPGGGDRNFSLNQGRFGEEPDQRAKWTARGSPNSGIGDFSTPNGTATTELQHVVYTHDATAGEARIYVDGVEEAFLAASGNYDDWVVSRELALVNEAGLVGSGRSWIGELHLVAVYNRALSSEEVIRNFESGSGTEQPSGLPQVSLTAPASDDFFQAPAEITLEADATDSNGAIVEVEFFVNGASVGTASASPFTATWSDVPIGFYTLTATATDDDGNETTSDPVDIAVRPAGDVNYTDAVTQDGPVAYWKFEETSGDTAADEIGSHDATLVNGPDLAVDGIQGSGIQFISANGTYAEVPDHAELDITESISLEFWLNIGDDWSEAWEAIIGKGDDTYQVRRSGESNNLRFDVRGGGGGDIAVTSEFEVSPNEWVHVVAVYDMEAGEMRLFFNGEQDPGTAARTGTIGVNDFGLQIGNNFSGTEYRRHLDARVDEVAVYNTALSGERIVTHYFAAQEPSVGAPELSVAVDGGLLILSWPASATGFGLQHAGTIAAPVMWEDATEPVNQQGNEFVVEITPDEDEAYFRLIQQ